MLIKHFLVSVGTLEKRIDSKYEKLIFIMHENNSATKVAANLHQVNK